MTTRREILKTSAAPLIVPSLVLGQRAGAVPPSDKIVPVAPRLHHALRAVAGKRLTCNTGMGKKLFTF